MSRLTEKGFNFTTDYVKRSIDSWSVAQALGKLQQYEDLEEQGLLLINPLNLENTILNRMQEFMDEYRNYSQSSVDHFGGKADSMETAMKIVKGAFEDAMHEQIN